MQKRLRNGKITTFSRPQSHYLLLMLLRIVTWLHYLFFSANCIWLGIYINKYIIMRFNCVCERFLHETTSNEKPYHLISRYILDLCAYEPIFTFCHETGGSSPWGKLKLILWILVSTFSQQWRNDTLPKKILRTLIFQKIALMEKYAG